MSQFAYDTVSAMIAPALLMTATGSLLISTAARIGRIVDRIRSLVTLGENGRLEQAEFPELWRKHIIEEMGHLRLRGKRASVAVTMLYAAFCAFAMTSMTIALNAITGHHLPAVPLLCAIAGVGLLIVACVNLLLEARTSLKGTDRELLFYNELESLRSGKVASRNC